MFAEGEAILDLLEVYFYIMSKSVGLYLIVYNVYILLLFISGIELT